MGIPNDTRQAASNAVAARGNWIGLHTAAAGTTGAAEATGGGYGRVQIPGGTWTPSGTGSNTGGEVAIPVAAGNYVEGSVWSAQAGGTFVGSGVFAGGTINITGTGASIAVTPSINA